MIIKKTAGVPLLAPLVVLLMLDSFKNLMIRICITFIVIT